MADLVFSYFTTELSVDFTKNRGQSYDNAANMADGDRYNGMQQRIIQNNKFARFIPCAGHYLNLVGRSAVDCCLDAVNCVWHYQKCILCLIQTSIKLYTEKNLNGLPKCRSNIAAIS